MLHHLTSATSFKYAFKGIIYSLKYNRHLRVDLGGIILVVIAGLFFHITQVEWGFVLFTSIFVIIAEMINTAIEEVVDLLTKEHRVEAMIAKDTSAGMVLIVFFGALIIGSYVFLPYIFRLLWQ